MSLMDNHGLMTLSINQLHLILSQAEWLESLWCMKTMFFLASNHTHLKPATQESFFRIWKQGVLGCHCLIKIAQEVKSYPALGLFIVGNKIYNVYIWKETGWSFKQEINWKHWPQLFCQDWLNTIFGTTSYLGVSCPISMDHQPWSIWVDNW